MAERLPYFAVLVLFAIFTSYGIYRRRSHDQACGRAFTSKLAWTSASLATAMVGSIFPACWAFASYTWHGGTIDANLPPGYSTGFILGSPMVGCAFTAISTVYGYTEHLDPE